MAISEVEYKNFDVFLVCYTNFLVKLIKKQRHLWNLIKEKVEVVYCRCELVNQKQGNSIIGKYEAEIR